MFISTRGRYALRVMCDLLEHEAEGFVPLKEVADRQRISLKYLESIMKLLVQEHLVEGSSGRGGGYRLCRAGDDYSVGEILRCTEGTLAPVTCVDGDGPQCEYYDSCFTFPLWEGLKETIDNYLSSVTLSQLLSRAKAHRKETCDHE